MCQALLTSQCTFGSARGRLLPLHRLLPSAVEGCPSQVHQRLVPRQRHRLLPSVLPRLQPSVSRQPLASRLLLDSRLPSANPASQRHREAHPHSQVAQHLVAVAHQPTLVASGLWQLPLLLVASARWQLILVVASGRWQRQLPRQEVLEPRHLTSPRLEVSRGSEASRAGVLRVGVLGWDIVGRERGRGRVGGEDTLRQPGLRNVTSLAKGRDGKINGFPIFRLAAPLSFGDCPLCTL